MKKITMILITCIGLFEIGSNYAQISFMAKKQTKEIKPDEENEQIAKFGI